MPREAFFLGLLLCPLLAMGAYEAFAGQAVLQFGTIGLFGFLAFLSLYYLIGGTSVAAIFVRAILALLPIATVIFLIVRNLLELEEYDQPMIRAVIAGVVVAAGWVVGFVTTEWRAANQEQEKRRDMVDAVMAEIRLITNHSQKMDWDAAIEEVKQRFYNDRRYEVFIYYGHQFSTLKRLVQQVEILERAQIMPIMNLFQLLDRLERMEKRLGDTAFAELGWERRQEGLIRYLTLQKAVLNIGTKALCSLEKGGFQGWLRHFK